MRSFKVLAFLFLVLGLPHEIFAQKKTPNKKETIIPVPKFRAPKLETYLDVYKDSATVNAESAQKLIGTALKILDDNKNVYEISSYQFLFKKTGVTEDEASGKLTPTSSISSERFKTTPLPDLWVNLIRQDVKKGDEFYFFDVIAKNSQGRVMYAPSLKILIR